MNQSRGSEEEGACLETLGQGAAVELFNDALADVLRNIADPNTNPEGIREITLKVKVKPGPDRQFGKVAMAATTKLQPPKAVETVLFIAPDGSKAFEHNPNQMKLFPPETDSSGNVTVMADRKEANGR